MKQNMKMNSTFTALAASALLLGASNAASIALVNADFELPGRNTTGGADPLTGGQWDVVPNWTPVTGSTYNGSGTTTERNRTTGGAYGGKFTFFGDGREDGAAFQLTDHTIAEGDEFTLKFWMDSTFSTSQLAATLIHGASTNVISTSTHSVENGDGFTEFTLTGTATAPMAGDMVGVMFQGVALFPVVDDVTLSFEPVPEPSSTLLLGLGGLGLILRRRK